MKTIGILLKKDFRERLSGIKNSKKDVAGIILNILLTAIVLGVFVYAFSYFTNTYANIKIGYVTVVSERVFEILTIFYTLLFALICVMGVIKLNKNLIDAGNLTLLSMPVKPMQIYISKFCVVYIELLITSFIISVPTFILLIAQGLIGVPSIVGAVFFSTIVPVIALGVASIFTVPFYYLKKWLNKHVVIQLIVYTLLMISAFLVYSIFLRFIKGLMESGEITFFFNSSSVYYISKICSALYPANIFASIIMGKNVFVSIILMLISVALSILICYYMSKFIFWLVRQNKIGLKVDVIVKKHIRTPRKPTVSLMAKEYLNVLRTPSYAFNYFAVILTLPLMVVITSSLLCSMMKELTLLNCDFEIVLCALSMFSIILNSFCANNISRDGKFFNLLKTLPISPKTIILSKIVFCSISSVVSIFFTGIALMIAGVLSPLKILAVFIICSVLSFGVICLATRKDLNTTKNKLGEENTSSTNFLVFWGLVISVGFTVVSFVFSLYFQTRFNLLISNLISSVILLGFSALVLGVSLIYLFKNLDKKFKETIQ